MLPFQTLLTLLATLALGVHAHVHPHPEPRALAERFGQLKVHSVIRDEDHSHDWCARHGFKRDGDEEEDFDMTFHLHAHDQDFVHSEIAAMSDPDSPRYMKWMTPDEAAHLTRANGDAVEMALDYLAEHGIKRDNVKVSHNKRALSFDIAPSVANRMLAADYRHYEIEREPTTNMPQNQMGTRTLSIPEYLHSYIAMVQPGTDFGYVKRFSNHGSAISDDHAIRALENDRDLGDKLQAYEREVKEQRAAQRRKTKGNLESRRPNNGTDLSDAVAFDIVQGQNGGPPISSNLNNCWHNFSPNCAKVVYHIPSAGPTCPNGVCYTTFGTLNLKPYCDSDVSTGLSLFAPNVPSGYLPIRYDIATTGTDSGCAGDPGEPDLDLQISIPQVYPIKQYNFQGSNLRHAAIFEAVAKMGYNSIPFVDVLSVSYGASEYSVSDTLTLCAMTDPQVAMGMTLVVSSGDNGYQDMNIPALCPNWISVGASQTGFNQTVTAAQVSEAYGDGLNYKGSGGFSNYRQTAQSFQSPALAAYKQQYTDYTYGSLQTYAATPDMSAQGRAIPVYYTPVGKSSALYLFGGTSASAPLFGAMLALINNQRKARGQGIIGNQKPTFYSSGATTGSTSLWRDVTVGNNFDGYKDAYNITYNNFIPPPEGNYNSPWPATTGWDASTGWGTPLFDRFTSWYQTH